MRVPSSQEVFALAAAGVVGVAATVIAAPTVVSSPTVVPAAAVVSAAAAAEQDQNDDQDQPHTRAVIVVPHVFVHLTCHALHYPMLKISIRSLTVKKSEEKFIDRDRLRRFI